MGGETEGWGACTSTSTRLIRKGMQQLVTRELPVTGWIEK